MLFRPLFSLSLVAATVLAAPVSIQQTSYKRDLPTIQAALNTINSALQDLDNSVKATNSVTLGGGIQLLSAVTNVKTTIQDATTQVRGSEVLNKQDALNLKAATDALTNNVKVTINDVVAKKALVDSLGATPLVAAALQDQKTASVALAQALVSKVPPELGEDAQKSATALSTVLDQGIAIYLGTAAPVAAPAQAPAAPGGVAGGAGPSQAAASQAAVVNEAAAAQDAATAQEADPVGSAATDPQGAEGFLSGLMGLFGMI